ncbi:hypothetical protein, partial [Bacillus pumilus]|uniref:hypothetical protein n=1 Tax=Bacillus pumilus TaxID=1408 RepID=UPI0011A3CF0F
MSVVIEELEVGYEGVVGDEGGEVGGMEMEWRDYVDWENEEVRDDEGEEWYWVKTLEGEVRLVEVGFEC